MIQIPLRLKYRRGFKGRFKGGERAAPRKHRKKIGGLAHEKIHGKAPVMDMLIDKKGHATMRRVG